MVQLSQGVEESVNITAVEEEEWEGGRKEEEGETGRLSSGDVRVNDRVPLHFPVRPP